MVWALLKDESNWLLAERVFEVHLLLESYLLTEVSLWYLMWQLEKWYD